MDEKQLIIINSSLKLFIKQGVKGVTMSDIARELGMSKKTLYLYFKDKNDLVIQVLNSFLDHHKSQIKNISEQSINAIDELLAIYQMNTKNLQEVKLMILFGLKKYYPKAWIIYDEFKRSFLFKCIEDNIKRGIHEGLYRTSINSQIISIAYTGMINLIFDSDVFSEKGYDFNQLYLELFKYHIRGIASQKGVNYLENKMNI
ncbi:MAG: TetR/AcrR family transcriptional regulator [Flavobacteriales bacterium]|nr:TetR/AcrR family transcriptional regulator [Flavobacteriales bacterium]